MDRSEMLRVFEAHREAEAARDIDAILETFVPDCFLETVPLGLRSEGKDAVRAAYEMQFFSAFPDLAPEDEGIAYHDDVVAVWGTLRGTSQGSGSASRPAAAPLRCPSPTWFRSGRGSWPARGSTSTSPRYASRPGSRSIRCARRRPPGRQGPEADRPARRSIHLRTRPWALGRRGDGPPPARAPVPA